MLETAPTATADLVLASSQLVEYGRNSREIELLDDAALLGAQAAVSQTQRLLDLHRAWIAATIARRSTRELGHAGLAQAEGFLSPVALIQSVAGVTKAEASKLIEMGSMLSEIEAMDDVPAFAATAPWQEPIARAVLAGALSIDGGEAIRRGLGEVDPVITAAMLRDAAERLVRGAGGKSVEQLQRDARLARGDLDVESVARHEKEQRDLRFLRAYRRADGMVGGSFLLAPEGGEFLMATLDAMTSPRRGGPRWVDPRAKLSEEELLGDSRTNEQINVDTLVDLFHVAVEADPSRFPGATRPAVRVVTTDRMRTSSGGHGVIEGTVNTVSRQAVERLLCNDGLVPVEFDDDGQCVNVGRDQRRFTARQRVGMAVRDGGCTFNGCDRPPAWCEAHHIDFWARDGGKTDIADGILLCRRHHLLMHNNGWEVKRDGGRYSAIPPAAVDSAREARPMQRRNPVLRRVPDRPPVSGEPWAVSHER